MERGKAIQILKKELEKIPDLRRLPPGNEEFKLWHDRVSNVIDAALDSRDKTRFFRAVPLRIDWSWASGEKPVQDQAQYDGDITEYETALKSIIQGYEITEMDTSKRKLLTELKQLHSGFVRYKQLVLMQEKERVAANLEAEFQELRVELERKYGSLKSIIKEYGSSTKVLLQGGNYECEAFISAFSYTAFSPGALEIVMDTAIAAVNTAIGKLEALSTSEVLEEAVYPSGTPYDAYKDIKEIISLATKKLIVVDAYVDSSVVTLLENVHSGVEIQVLTRKMQGDFQLAAQKFKEQREKAGQGSFEVRKDKSAFHDRFIVADSKFFHLGASIKDAGEKVCAISEIENSSNKNLLMGSISKSWDAAEKVL